MQRARIVVSASSRAPNVYQFDLFDVDGPRYGRRLADLEVSAGPRREGQRPAPDPAHAARARYQLRQYGKRNNYVVIEDPSDRR